MLWSWFLSHLHLFPNLLCLPSHVTPCLHSLSLLWKETDKFLKPNKPFFFLKKATKHKKHTCTFYGKNTRNHKIPVTDQWDQNAQIKQYKTKTNPSKLPLSLFCVDHLLLTMGPSLKCDLYSQLSLHWPKLIFPLQQVMKWK